jgi:hypothetical protein
MRPGTKVRFGWNPIPPGASKPHHKEIRIGRFLRWSHEHWFDVLVKDNPEMRDGSNVRETHRRHAPQSSSTVK